MVTKCFELRAKLYSYLIDDNSEDEKPNCMQKCVIKRRIKPKIYKNCFEGTNLDNKINYLQKQKQPR